MKLDLQVSNCIRQCILDEFHPSKIMIFGSYATGTATPESDVDIMAIVGDDQEVGREATVKRMMVGISLRTVRSSTWT